MLKFYLAKLSRHETDGPGHATVCQDKLTKQARPRFQASKAHAGMESTFRPGMHNLFLVGIPVLIVKENVQIQVDRTRIRSRADHPRLHRGPQENKNYI